MSKEIYAKVDNEIWKAIWKWSVRRHPKKNKAWIHAKYFRKIKECNHCFSCDVKNESGNGGMLFTLVYASNTTIKRYTKIKCEATPFDPAYSIYFEERITSKMSGNKEGRAKIVALWRRQKGHCSICSEKITTDTGWFIHFLESRTQGGKTIYLISN